MGARLFPSTCRCLAARRRRGSGVFEVQMVDIREAGNLMAETGSAHDIEKENPPPCGANGRTILPATGRAAEGAGEPEPGGGGGIYELVDEVQEHAGGAPGAATTPAAADDGLTMVDNELYRSVGEAHQRGAVVEAAGAGPRREHFPHTARLGACHTAHLTSPTAPTVPLPDSAGTIARLAPSA
ncbi:unnamed protein product [Lampetra fluviatilis]